MFSTVRWCLSVDWQAVNTTIRETEDLIQDVRERLQLPQSNGIAGGDSVSLEDDYLGPNSWPYSDPTWTDVMLAEAGYQIRRELGYATPALPHVQHLKGATRVWTPKGHGYLHFNWDDRVGVILDGSSDNSVTFFTAPEDLMRIQPLA